MIQSLRTSSRSLEDEPSNNLKVFRILATGLTSEVMLCRIKRTDYAMKVFKPEIKRDFRLNEIAILDMMDHINIVAMIYYDEHEPTDWLVTELLYEKDLFDFIAIKQTPFDQKIVLYIFSQLLSAVEYVHEQGVCHRDLKLENILFSPDDFTLKLCDFGFSTKENKQSIRKVGTDGYMAPELFEDDFTIDFEQLYKVDIFALGVILFILLFSYPLFTCSDSKKGCPAWKSIASKKWELLWKQIEKRNNAPVSLDIKQLIEGMLNSNPDKRWNIKQIKESEFMTKEKADFEQYINEMKERASLLEK